MLCRVYTNADESRLATVSRTACTGGYCVGFSIRSILFCKILAL